MAGRRRAAAAPQHDLDAVDFMCNENAEWALFWVTRPDYGAGYDERLYARKVGRDRITFGFADHGRYEEGSPATPLSDGDRTFRISSLRRVLDGVAPRISGGSFSGWRGDTVTYRTSCGQERVIRLSVLRALIDDAEALP